MYIETLKMKGMDYRIVVPPHGYSQLNVIPLPGKTVIIHSGNEKNAIVLDKPMTFSGSASFYIGDASPNMRENVEVAQLVWT